MKELLAERVGGLVVKKDDLATALMKPGDMDLAAMFMYMIGNCDYSISGRHNMKILGMPGFGTEGYTPVPYDFDYSGLIDASYAIPGEDEDYLTAIDQIWRLILPRPAQIIC